MFEQQMFYWDTWLLKLLNIDWASPALDPIWLHLTQLHKVVWFKFGIFPAILAYGFSIYRWHFLKVLVAVALAVALADTLAYRVVKASVERPRPFQHAQVSTWVRKVGEAHGSSFPSNHAANVFAGAVVLAWYFRRARYFFYSFAALVAISRPILGVHYPSDALAGSVLGWVVGLLLTSLIFQHVRFFWLPTRVSELDRKISA